MSSSAPPGSQDQKDADLISSAHAHFSWDISLDKLRSLGRDHVLAVVHNTILTKFHNYYKASEHLFKTHDEDLNRAGDMGAQAKQTRADNDHIHLTAFKAILDMSEHADISELYHVVAACHQAMESWEKTHDLNFETRKAQFAVPHNAISTRLAVLDLAKDVQWAESFGIEVHDVIKKNIAKEVVRSPAWYYDFALTLGDTLQNMEAFYNGDGDKVLEEKLAGASADKEPGIDGKRA